MPSLLVDFSCPCFEFCHTQSSRLAAVVLKSQVGIATDESSTTKGSSGSK